MRNIRMATLALLVLTRYSKKIHRASFSMPRGAMLGIRVILLLLMIVLMLGCSRRWEKETLRIGVFSSTEHWIETGYWMLEKRSGVEYTAICNRSMNECYRNGGGDDEKVISSWIDISPDEQHAAIYSNNVDGRFLEQPLLAVFNVRDGSRIDCAGMRADVGVGDIRDTGNIWKDGYGLSSIYSSHQNYLYLYKITDGACEAEILKQYPSSTLVGWQEFSDTTQEIAWAFCEEECQIVRIDLVTRKEQIFPFQRCKSAPDTGFVEWADGVLQHVCSGGGGRKSFRP